MSKRPRRRRTATPATQQDRPTPWRHPLVVLPAALLLLVASAAVVVGVAGSMGHPSENPVARMNRELEECRAAYRAATSARDSARALKRVLRAPDRRGFGMVTCRDVLRRAGGTPLR